MTRPISVSLVKLGYFPTKLKLARSTNVKYPSALQVITDLESRCKPRGQARMTHKKRFLTPQFQAVRVHTHLHDIPHLAPVQKQPFFTDHMSKVEYS